MIDEQTAGSPLCPWTGKPTVRRSSRDTLLAYALGLAVLVPLTLPVLDNMEEGRRLVAEGVLTAKDRLRPTGLGPVSGLMVYVFSAPVAVHLSRTLASKLASVLGLALLALLTSLITGILERGEIMLGLSMAWLTAAALVGGGLWLWRGAARRRKEVQALADSLAAEVKEVVAETRGSALGELAHDSRESRQSTEMIERMVMGAIWQSSAEGPPETFRARLLMALGDVRADITGNPAIDPDGQALMLADRIVDRIQRRLRRTERAGRQ